MFSIRLGHFKTWNVYLQIIGLKYFKFNCIAKISGLCVFKYNPSLGFPLGVFNRFILNLCTQYAALWGRFERKYSYRTIFHWRIDFCTSSSFSQGLLVAKYPEMAIFRNSAAQPLSRIKVFLFWTDELR